MAISIKGMTNTTPNSQLVMKLTCPELWSMAQEFAYNRLSDKVSTKDFQETVKLLEFYNARARRVAATYARFYLEKEERGDPSKKGRYYWMALGAFAVKTVVCIFEEFDVAPKSELQVQNLSGAAKKIQTMTGIASYILQHPTARIILSGVSTTTANLAEVLPSVSALAKGNLWLFMDIAPWHWLYSVSPKTWNSCSGQRDASSYPVPQVSRAIKILPWSQATLPKINYLKKTTELEAGFALIKEIEALIGKTDKPSMEARAKKQLEHLMAIAEHEQGNVLQKISWDDPALAKASALTRKPYIKPFAPKAQIVFAQACEAQDERLKSVAPDDMIVENLGSRMKWIKVAARDFHNLMQGKTFPGSDVYMEGQLAAIAEWVNAADPKDQPPKKG